MGTVSRAGAWPGMGLSLAEYNHIGINKSSSQLLPT